MNYINRYLELLKNSQSEEETEIIINKIYEDGFCDGLTSK